MATLNDAVNGGSTERTLLGDHLVVTHAKLKTLVSAVVGANPHSTPRELGTAAGYVVPTGMKFKVVAVWFVQGAGGGAGAPIVLQTATSDVGFRSAAEPTGVDLSVATAALATVGLSVGASTSTMFNPTVTIPAGKYLHFYQASAGDNTAVIYGYEIETDAEEL